MSTLVEQHIMLYQSQFNPTEKTGASKVKLEEFNKLFESVKKNDKKYLNLCHKMKHLPEDYLQINAMSVGYFMLSCLLLVFYYLQYLEMVGTPKWIGFLVYVPSLLVLLARFFLKQEKFPVTKGAIALYLVHWSVCMIFGGLLHIQILGTELGWIAVYTISGTALTLCIRSSQNRKINKKKKELENKRAEITSFDADLEKLTELYLDLRKSGIEAFRTFENEHQLSSIQREYPASWFSCTRSKTNYYSVKARSVATDFVTLYENSSSSDMKGYSETYTIQRVNSQDLGWKTISGTEAQQLLKTKKIYPFFSLGLPYFSDEWEYCLLKHSWDVVITKETYYEYTVTEKYTSDAQREFDLWTGLAEDSVLGLSESVENLQFSSDYQTAGLADKYLEKKKQIRDEIGGTVIKQSKVDKKENVDYLIGDEIGAMLVKNKDGKILGVYAGDSYQSLKFISKLIKDQLDFEFTPAITAFGETQEKYLIDMYFI